MENQRSSGPSVWFTLFLAFVVPGVLFWLAKTTTPLWYVVFVSYLLVAFALWAREVGKSWTQIFRMMLSGISGPIAVIGAVILLLALLFGILMVLSALIGV